MPTKTIEHKPTNIVEVYHSSSIEPNMKLSFHDGADRIEFITAGGTLVNLDRRLFRQLCEEFLAIDAARRSIEGAINDDIILDAGRSLRRPRHIGRPAPASPKTES